MGEITTDLHRECPSDVLYDRNLSKMVSLGETAHEVTLAFDAVQLPLLNDEELLARLVFSNDKFPVCVSSLLEAINQSHFFEGLQLR